MKNKNRCKTCTGNKCYFNFKTMKVIVFDFSMGSQNKADMYLLAREDNGKWLELQIVSNGKKLDCIDDNYRKCSNDCIKCQELAFNEYVDEELEKELLGGK
ncbi:MAG: hypothetical protein HWN81_00575 [Candidatus Lokiarchaeota archaeon]|nr:hypothetical protein [Candidatus Lokiarchaeota archaeon]